MSRRGRTPAGGRGAERLRGRVRDMAHGGDAAVETERGIVMVRGPLPGEEVDIEVEARRAGVHHGKLLRVVGAESAERVVAPCEVQARCGGCPWMTWDLTAQLRHKRGTVERAISGQSLPGTEVALVASPDPLGYRRRARLAWERRGTRAEIGYRIAGGRGVTPIARCPVLDAGLSGVLPLLLEQLGPVLAGGGEIELTPGADGVCVSMVSEGAQPPEVYAACQRLAGGHGVAGVALRAGGIGAPALWGTWQQRLPGADGQPLTGPADGFSQANAAINQRLVELVVELAQPRGAKVLELYAGHGNLTVCLAPGVAELTAVELDPELTKACRANLDARGLGHVKVRTDAAEAGAKGSAVDCVVLDPPRTGAKEALEGIVARRPQRIVYVSCDPVTLRRDLQRLAEAGYRVDRAHALDMFPHTAHVESVVRLVRI